eukprot:s472_g17.t1
MSHLSDAGVAHPLKNRQLDEPTNRLPWIIHARCALGNQGDSSDTHMTLLGTLSVMTIPDTVAAVAAAGPKDPKTLCQRHPKTMDLVAQQQGYGGKRKIFQVQCAVLWCHCGQLRPLAANLTAKRDPFSWGGSKKWLPQ